MGGPEISNQGGLPAAFQKSGRAMLLSSATPDQLVAALDAASRDPGIYCALNEQPAGPGELGQTASGGAAQAIWRIDRFGKPLVSLLQGTVTWENFAFVINGTHKVGDPELLIAFGGVASGQVPTLGASYHLPALPRNLGLYLALTGSSLDSALAYSVGWLTHRIPASQFGRIKAALAAAEPIDAVLDELDLGAGKSPLEPHLAPIERCFSGGGPKAILADLDATAGASTEWARHCASAMRAVPERTLEASYNLLTAQVQPTLRQSLELEAVVTLNLPDPAPPSIS